MRCEIGLGLGLGFGSGDWFCLGLGFGTAMKLRRWMEVSWTVEMCFIGVIRGQLGSIFLLAEKSIQGLIIDWIYS
jgi:hypothetical protein